MDKPFSIKKLLKSFVYAFNGLYIALSREQNMKIHLVAAVIAIVLGCVLKINATDFAIVFLCIGAVISMEIINTAIEKLCDFVAPEYHNQIKLIKDLAAGAVLLMAIIALIVGIYIFVPKIISLYSATA